MVRPRQQTYAADPFLVDHCVIPVTEGSVKGSNYGIICLWEVRIKFTVSSIAKNVFFAILLTVRGAHIDFTKS